jgi:hypothetical protein
LLVIQGKTEVVMTDFFNRHRPFVTLVFALLIGALLPALLGKDTRWVVVIVGCSLGICDWLWPALVRPVWVGLEKAGKMVGEVANLLFMTVLYVLVMMPIGLCMKVPRWRGSLVEPASPNNPEIGAESGSPPSFYGRIDEKRVGTQMERAF